MSDHKGNEPLKSQVMTGYFLTKARTRFKRYMWKANECLAQSIQDMKDDGQDIVAMDVAEESADILRVMGDVESRVADIHRRLRKVSLASGNREITDADFLEFGGGGGR